MIRGEVDAAVDGRQGRGVHERRRVLQHGQRVHGHVVDALSDPLQGTHVRAEPRHPASLVYAFVK